MGERSTCLVEKCRLDTIEQCGVQVDGGARGVIMNSSVSYCKQNGIYLLDGAKGVIEGCNIFGCSFPGVAVNAADPVITRNRIHHNERSGLVIAGRSEDNTLVEDNNIFANGRDGVMIAKDAVCLLQGNAIFDNKGAGVQIMSGASPQLVKTHVYSNKDCGIVITKGGNAHISGEFVVRCLLFKHKAEQNRVPNLCKFKKWNQHWEGLKGIFSFRMIFLP